MSATATVGTLEEAQVRTNALAAKKIAANAEFDRLMAESHANDPSIRTRARAALPSAQQQLWLAEADAADAQKDLDRARAAHKAVLAAEARAERQRQIQRTLPDVRALLKRLGPVEAHGSERLEPAPALSGHLRQWLEWGERELES